MKKKVETAKQIRRKVIRAATTEHQETKRRLQTARAVSMDMFEKAEAVLRTAEVCSLDVNRHWVSANYFGGLHMHISVKADSLKSGPITAFIGFLDGMLGATGSRDYVGAEYAERNYDFGDRYENGLCVHLEVDVSDAATCRKVKVGEKLEMVAQYEIQCGD